MGRFRLTSEPSLSSRGVWMMDGRELGDRTHGVAAGMDEAALKGFIYLMKLSALTKDAAASLRTELGARLQGPRAGNNLKIAFRIRRQNKMPLLYIP